MEIQKKLQADFFKTENGNEPVRDFLKAFSSDLELAKTRKKLVLGGKK